MQMVLKEMMVHKDPNLLTGLLELFLCFRPSQAYALMICHVFEVLPVAIIKKIVEMGKSEAMRNNQIFQGCIKIYRKALDIDPEYNTDIIKLFAS
mmetsp:Transcript_25504/g.22661  ORF Transcript_25504/g.22661 Transcript_25504/m.22661 type:complete len:95 (+) Transcript_25504:148-432(+)